MGSVRAVDGKPITGGNEPPEQAAARLLDRHWGATIPVDPARIARALGLRVMDVYLDDDVSGALVKEPDTQPSIALNAEHHPNRKRFTLAHEIGHFVKRGDSSDDYEYIDRRDERSSTGTRDEEVYANRFAAALLMPEDSLRTFHRRGWNPNDMAKQFGVSREAMDNRLKNLQLSGW